MTALGRRGFLLGLCGAVLCAGCSFPTMAYFLMPEAREPAEYKRLASDDDKKEVKVVLWTYMALDPRPEFIQADRQLTELLAQQIRQLSEENREKVTVVPPRQVEAYKNDHPSWKNMELAQVGRDFKADYVVSLEISQLSLYEVKSVDLYRGRATISLSVVDVKHPEENMAPREFSDLFPGGMGSVISSMDMSPMEFRQLFLTHTARRLAFNFVMHPKRDRILME